MRLAIISHDGIRRYLFSVPSNISLKEGDRVVCKTRYGESDGICTYDSFDAEGTLLDVLINIIGANKPLAPVIGVYQKVMFGENRDDPKTD